MVAIRQVKLETVDPNLSDWVYNLNEVGCNAFSANTFSRVSFRTTIQAGFAQQVSLPPFFWAEEEDGKNR